MMNALNKSAVEEGSSQGGADDCKTWIDFDSCLDDDEEEQGYIFEEWWVKLRITDQGKDDAANHCRISRISQDEEAKEALLVSGKSHPHFSLKPLARRFCSSISQRLRRYSFRLTKRNTRQDKEPLLSES